MSRRGPGWPTVLALALVVLGFSVFHPLQLMMVPLALLLVALPPRSPGLLGFAAVLLGLVFVSPRGGLWGVERGWSLLVAAWFVLAVLGWPRASFVGRGVVAVLAAAATGGFLIAASGGWSGLDWAMEARFREAAAAMASALPPQLGDSDVVVQRAAELPALLFPALLGVASLASLALGWWAYRRLSGRGEPLGRLPEFRFPDLLVWLLIAGLVLVVVPPGSWAPRVGGNLILFMGALYALRGLAVTLALVGLHAPTLVVLALVGVVLWPIMMAGTLLVGVTDTWVDLRAASRAAGDEG